jgi:gliding motility-associated-like protein
VDENYSFSYVAANFPVTKATLTATADAKTKVYGATNPTLTFVYSGWVNGNGIADLATAPTASTTVTVTSPVAVYTGAITVSGGVDENYSFSYVAANFPVTKATLTVTADAKTKVYGEANPTLTFLYSGWVNGVETIDVAPSITTTVDGTTIVGTYADAITLSGGSDNNYTFSLVSGDLEVTKAVLTATADNQTKVYGEANPTLTFQYSGWVNGVEAIDVAPSIITTLDGTTIVGTYADAITLSGGSDNNYTFSFVANTFNVTKATLTATADAKTKVYGAANPALTFQYSGWLNGVEAIDAAPSITTTVDGTTVVGSYSNSITLSGGSDNNYTFSFVANTFNVTKATLTATADAQTKVYGEANPSLTFQYSGWLNGDDAEELTTKPSASTTVSVTSPVDVYTGGITVAGGLDENYNFSYNAADFSVTKATLTVTADAKTKVSGEANPALTFQYSGWLNGDDAEDLTTKPSASTTVSVTSPVDVYTGGITVAGGVDENYNFSYNAADFSVTKATLTVTADAKTKVYGEANPVLTFLYSGWVNGVETIDVAPSITTTVNGTTSAGTYTDAITLSDGLDNNYTFSYVSGTLDVTKAILTAAAEPKTKVYGSDNTVLTISWAGFRNNDEVSVIDELPSISTLALKTSDVGLYDINITGGSDNNYDLNPVNGSLDIEKAPLVIVADDKAKTYLEPIPELTFTWSGFVLGQNQDVIDVVPVLETVANKNSDAGTYDIIASGGVDGNYSFTYENGTLAINKADQVITFEEIPAGLRTTQDHQLIAETTSGLSITFETSDPIIGSIYGAMLSVNKEGNLTITASQPGNQNWNPAQDVSREIVTLPTFDNLNSLFTPNNDGMNDYWYIPDLEKYGRLQVTVYNRFGQKVYGSDGYKNDWDGTWNGYPLPSASYYYIMKSSTKGYIKGVVNLVR